MIRKALAGISFVAIVSVGLAACGNSGGGSSGGATYPGNGNADNGKTVVLGKGGCGACHTIAGTTAQGKIGPELTHVGTLLTPDQIYTQVVNPQQRPAPYATPLQQGATMPKPNLSGQEQADVTAYLATLK